MTRVAVIGIGLIGGSVAAALREHGDEVIGYDPDTEAGRTALERALVDEMAPALTDAVSGVSAVLVAAPPDAVLQLLPDIDRSAPPGALLVDLASVKGDIVQLMERLPHGERAIGGHPLAGKEQSGPAGADPLLLRGRPFALCPTPRTDSRTRQRAEELVRRLGSYPVVLKAEAHDEIVARVSHVPQLVSTGLALSIQRGDEQLVGPGLHDMTRLAASPPGLWADILHANRAQILPGLRRLSDRLDDLASCIERRDRAALMAALAEGTEAASRLRAEARR